MERDYPKGHPKAADYKGERYAPPSAPHGSDFDQKHPAHGGKNVSELDTPDGKRKAQLQREQDMGELVNVGAIPTDREHEADDLAPEADDNTKALAFLEAKGYSKPAATELIRRVGASTILNPGPTAPTERGAK